MPELVPEEALEKSGAKAARAAFAHVPVIEPDQLAEADAIIFGTPDPVRQHVRPDAELPRPTGGLWLSGALIGKVGSVFASTGQPARRPGDDHHQLPHDAAAPRHDHRRRALLRAAALTNMDEITGGTPYGATTLAGADGTRQPSENELAIARFQGKHVAEIARKLAAGR